MTEFIAPQLLSPAVIPPVGDGWIYEEKLDGMRLLVISTGEGVRLLTRTGQDWTARFPILTRTLREQFRGRSLVLDGELVVLDANGTANFKALCALLGKGGAGLSFVAFDLLVLDGCHLLPLPLLQRKAMMARLEGHAVACAPYNWRDGDALLRAVASRRGEGVVAKRVDAPYRSGARTREWLKIKCTHRSDHAVVGWLADAAGNVKSIAVADATSDGLHYRGMVSSGLTRRHRAGLPATLRKLENGGAPINHSSRAPHHLRWLRPILTAEIRARLCSPEDLLREATILGLHEAGLPIAVSE